MKDTLKATYSNFAIYFFTLLVLTLISACGGGGDDDSSDAGEESIAQSDIDDTAIRTCGRESGPLIILPLGDSITESRQGQNSFRRSLWQRLNTAGCQVDFVGTRTGVSRGSRNTQNQTPPNPDFDLDHEGRWDFRVDEILPDVANLTNSFRPNIILAHLGTNDIFQGQSISGTVDEIAMLIDSVRATKADTTFIVSRVIPSSRDTTRVADLNAAIARLSSKSINTSPVLIVNQATDYFIGDNFDGIHPGDSGELKIADTYFNAIMSLAN